MRGEDSLDLDIEVASVLGNLRARLNVDASGTGRDYALGNGPHSLSFALGEYEFEQDLRASIRNAAEAAQGWGRSQDAPSPSGAAWLPQLTPCIVSRRPPTWAVTCYKVVAIRDGVPVSVFDGVTEYRTGTTVMQRIVDGHRGGLYVYRSLEQCLQRARAIFPADSALLGSERAVLKALAWNEERSQLPVKYEGGKEAFTYVHAVGVIPMAPTYSDPARGGPGDTAADRDVEGGRESVDHAAARRQSSLVRRQARTMTLEQEVAEMETRLIAASGTHISGTGRPSGAQRPPDNSVSRQRSIGAVAS